MKNLRTLGDKSLVNNVSIDTNDLGLNLMPTV